MHTPVTNELKTESLELLRAYYQSPSAALRNRVVELNLGLVRREAHHWVNQCTESYDDLMQVGSMGLLRAIERFDIAKGHAFSSFAVPYIRGEIQHYLRDKGSPVRIPRRWQTIQHQAAALTADLRSQLNRQPTDAEVAAGLQISLAELQEVKLAFRNRAPLSLDAPMNDDDDGSVSLAELMPDNRYQSFQLAQEDQIRLQQALVQLEQRTRDVLEFVFLYDLTQKETAERLGISSVTVSRRVKSGLKSLRQMMIAPTS
ncbi:MAG: RNA polymerase sigma factor SigF [Pegethrix bostrychoides GSE-TBD4-15B]|jgi:RNA polymerase sigma-B factor|uniref:RNA polymerase sigma factor SigF n=1 Tax=Pegethrix bostrychoides GSE-TBD4-15B TaxID=2839662 RepID=A0A951U3D0_9CYAN|nr:RNA polymerase sigma factor SigF [Pegethrix bostrychoides GSE-TBD4-15B]